MTPEPSPSRPPLTVDPGTRAGRRHRLARLLLAVAVLALAGGCISTATLEPPEVTLVDLEVVDATLFETTLDVAVRISNDNPEPLLVDGTVVKLELGGRRVGKGSSPERLEIPRFDSAVQRLEIHLNNLAVATRIKSIVESSKVDWGLTGKVWVAPPSGRTRAVPIASRGSLDLRAPAAMTPVAPE